MIPHKPLHEVAQLIVACETYIEHNGTILLHKRSADKKKFPGFWIGPGGHVDEGEDVFTAALREVKEETGVILDPSNVALKVLAYHHHVDRNELWIEYLFKANIPDEQSIINTHEGFSAWIPLDEVFLLEKVFPPSKYYFEHIFKKPGILYNYSRWKDSQLVSVQSEHVDTSA